ncbi:MAG: tetrahydrofolate dehydrogenase/cyclohydrolase catalytic domain-containing protein, partial [Acidimicrobiia bacterium]
MGARILDGKVASAAIKDELSRRVAGLKDRGVVPGLATVIIGDDPASHAYVRMKHKACLAVGLASFAHELPADTPAKVVLDLIGELNADPAVHGYLIQLPVPGQLDASELLLAVDPAKDADGLHPVNLGRLALGASGPRPCTPVGVQELLARNGIEIAGAHV